MPAGLVESQKLPRPIFTPSTKADQGEHDENIHPDKGGLSRKLFDAQADHQLRRLSVLKSLNKLRPPLSSFTVSSQKGETDDQPKLLLTPLNEV